MLINLPPLTPKAATAPKVDADVLVTARNQLTEYLKTKPELAARLIAMHFKKYPGLAEALAQDPKFHAWDELFAATKKDAEVTTVLNQVWPHLCPQDKDSILQGFVSTGRTGFLTTLIDSPMSNAKDREWIAGYFIDLGLLRGGSKEAKAAYITVLRELSPAVEKMFHTFDTNPKFAAACKPVTRDDLVQTVLGIDPKSVTDFFKKKANKARGIDAAVGELIVAAEGDAARIFAAASQAGAKRAELRGYKAEQAVLQKQADAFVCTVNGDIPHVADFVRRAGAARL